LTEYRSVNIYTTHCNRVNARKVRFFVVTRRRFLENGLGAGAIVTVASALGCARATRSEAGRGEQTQGRLSARPRRSGQSTTAPPSPALVPGEQALGLGQGRDGLLYVPRDLPKNRPVPLILLLHGARGGAKGVISRVGAFALADEFKMLVLAPDSRDGTWDVIHGGFGPDVTFIDSALDHVFSRLPIDPARLVVAGFSDGASYALSLGLINGDLFSHVIAFSPGFLVAKQRQGKPLIYVTHGTDDEILPIDSTSHRLVPALRTAGYTVEFRVFAGPHTVPPPIAHEAFEWLFKPRE